LGKPAKNIVAYTLFRHVHLVDYYIDLDGGGSALHNASQKGQILLTTNENSFISFSFEKIIIKPNTKCHSQCTRFPFPWGLGEVVGKQYYPQF
jgi:hypothetical protein